MAEDTGDKTEAPTPRRRAEAREQGNVARSQDLNAALLLLASMVLLNMCGPRIVAALRALLGEMLGPASLADFNANDALGGVLRGLILVAAALAPLLGGIVAVAIAANLIQVGFNFSAKPLQLNPGALNPLKGLGRIFGGGQGPMKLLLDVLKIVLVAAVAWSAVHDRVAQIISMQQLALVQIFILGAGIVYSIGLRIGLMMLVLAIIDYAWQRHRIEQQLKMTKQEVKEEMRRMEGDPKMKQRRRQIAIQVANQRLKKDVPTADVVVTNPTEFAIALKYDSATMAAPRVVAKGQGTMARRIRDIAVASGIPIIERKPLARALFKLVEVGHEVPEEFYAAIAEILAYVYELTGRSRLRQAVQ